MSEIMNTDKFNYLLDSFNLPKLRSEMLINDTYDIFDKTTVTEQKNINNTEYTCIYEGKELFSVTKFYEAVNSNSDIVKIKSKSHFYKYLILYFALYLKDLKFYMSKN